MNRNFSTSEIYAAIGGEYEVINEKELILTHPAPVDAADEKSITFCNWEGERAAELIRSTASEFVIINKGFDVSVLGAIDKTLVKVDNPRLAFTRLLHELFVPPNPPPEIHSSAQIGPGAVLGERVAIGPNVVIESDCVIGDDSLIEANAVILNGTKIGRNVIIHPGVVLGTPGFGYERQSDGTLIDFPQIAGIVIEDNVEIGANTCIDRGALGDTLIHSGTKIDNLVHISHNVEIGHDCMVPAHATLGGSVTVGDRTWIGLGSTVREKLSIGKDSLVGMGAVVVKNVGDGVVVAGVPAQVLRNNV